MTRLFYSDPLDATYMAKQHRMRFQVDDGGTMNTIVAGMERMVQSSSGRFYIHPDSLGLLEPQVGDMVQNPDDDVARVCPDAEPVVFSGWVKLADAKEFVGTAATIIQRNGVSFIWPEREAV